MAITALATFDRDLIDEHRRLQTPSLKHVFVGKETCGTRGRHFNHLRAQLKEGYWAVECAADR